MNTCAIKLRMKINASTITMVLGALLLSALVLVSPRISLAEEGVTKIHVMAFSGTDAIIIESNGHFGMVDSGESEDYPDGSDPRYPYRDGTTIGCGVEDELLSYLDSLGITEDNFDFYIGTHPHSDHIGTAGMIIGKYKPSKVYTPRYDDSYMTASWGLWDNQYVYDKLVSAANEVGAELYLDFKKGAAEDPDSHVCGTEFELGGARIELVNTDSSYETVGTSDANCISLGVKVTANGKVAYLAGDICNSDGDEDRLARTLGHVDFMKLGHHGNVGSNTYNYVMTLSPKVVYQTNGFEWLWDKPLKAVQDLGSRFYNSEELSEAGTAAFVVELCSDGVKTNMGPSSSFVVHNHYTGCYEAFDGNGVAEKLKGWREVSDGFAYFDNGPQSVRNAWIAQGAAYSYVADDALRAIGWKQIDGSWYHFDTNGLMQTGWLKLGDTWYWFDDTGKMAVGWKLIGSTWYYFDGSGAMTTGWCYVSSSWYYFDASGAMATGWRRIGSSWYFLSDSGSMKTGWVLVDGSWYWLDGSGAMRTGWLNVGGAWYWLASSGCMETGWQYIGGEWYYLEPSSGAMRTGWLFDGDGWYYLSGSGSMQYSRWIGSYYVLANGKMARNQWVGPYYVGNDGLWVA